MSKEDRYIEERRTGEREKGRENDILREGSEREEGRGKKRERQEERRIEGEREKERKSDEEKRVWRQHQPPLSFTTLVSRSSFWL